MLQKKLVKVLGYYIDASFIEGVIATFRKLLIDIYWIYGAMLTDEGLYELYLLVNDHQNLKYALLDLSKTVGVEEVEVFNEFKVEEIELNNSRTSSQSMICKNSFILHIPIYSHVTIYRRGEVYG